MSCSASSSSSRRLARLVATPGRAGWPARSWLPQGNHAAQMRSSSAGARVVSSALRGLETVTYMIASILHARAASTTSVIAVAACSSATLQRPIGPGQEQCGDPECRPANPPLGHNPWVRPGQHRSSRSSLPPRRFDPDRCGTATLNPAPAPTHQSCPSRRFLTEEPWPLGSTSSVARPRRRLGSHLHRGALRPRGQGMPSPRGRNLGHAVLGARPAGRWAVPGAQARTHPAHRPPKERHQPGRRYAAPARPTLRIRGVTNGVGVPMARRSLRRA
jgi:hypothetical protein